MKTLFIIALFAVIRIAPDAVRYSVQMSSTERNAAAVCLLLTPELVTEQGSLTVGKPFHYPVKRETLYLTPFMSVDWGGHYPSGFN